MRRGSPLAANSDGSVAGASPMPVTSAPSSASQVASQVPLKPGVPGDHHAATGPELSGWPCCYLLVAPPGFINL